MANLSDEQATYDALLRYGETSLEIDFRKLPVEKLANLQRFSEDPFASMVYDWSVVRQPVADAVVALFDQNARPGAVVRPNAPVIIVDLEYGIVRNTIKTIVDLFKQYGINLKIEPYEGISAPYIVTQPYIH
ncbi:MAG: FAD-dependent oxidoreductase [Candidatus Saccharimonas sp.]